MTTLTKKYDDICEIYINKLCNCITDFILNNNLPITPNMISIFRIILAISLLCYTKNYKVIAIIYLICRVFDNLDGILARKGKMQSKIGDKLDHYGDYIETLILFIILYINYKNKNIYYFIIPIILISYISLIISCQQKDLNKEAENFDKKESLKSISCICPECLYNNTWIFRLFGYGTTIVLMTLFLLYIPKFNKI